MVCLYLGTLGAGASGGLALFDWGCASPWHGDLNKEHKPIRHATGGAVSWVEIEWEVPMEAQMWVEAGKCHTNMCLVCGLWPGHLHYIQYSG